MQKYKINTYGCQMNVHESEKIAGILSKLGYESTDIDEEADIIVFNTCCIRDNAERRVYGNIGALKPLKKEKKELIIAVMGCMTQQKGAADALRKKFPFVDIVLGANNPEDMEEAVVNLKKSFIKVPEDTKPPVVENTPIFRTSYPNAWINIMYGCNNFCTYCIVPYVKGRERSRKRELIIDDIKRVLDEGYKEITLLGQNVDSYGSDFDNGDNFLALLSDIAKLDGKFRLRFMTSHPKDFNKDVIDLIAETPNICNNIHLPVQSGSSEVLRQMNRRYTREQYLSIIEYIRSKIPDCGITSDIMVGFPTETEKDFLDTVSLMEKVRFSNAFTFVYSPRKGTPAASMQQLPIEVKTERIKQLVALQNRITKEISDTYTGKTVEVLIEDVNPKYQGTICGRTESGRLVTTKGDSSLIGTFCDIEITQSRSASLFGNIRSKK